MTPIQSKLEQTFNKPIHKPCISTLFWYLLRLKFINIHKCLLININDNRRKGSCRQRNTKHTPTSHAKVQNLQIIIKIKLVIQSERLINTPEYLKSG